VPATEPRFHASAGKSAADELIFDLEDSVMPAAKMDARAAVVRALATRSFTGKTLAVRVNAVDTDWHDDDVNAVVGGSGSQIDCLVVPKIEAGDEVRVLDQRLTELERELGLTRAIGLELQIESARGLDRVSDIAAASPRIEALVFGPGDLAASLRMPQLSIGAPAPDYPGDLWHFFLARVVVAARANGVQPIDGPFAAFRDVDGLRGSARRAALLGCDGKWAIHPDQLAVINEAFTPGQDDVDRAAAIVAAYADAEKGVLRMGDEMIDEATRKMALVVMERARAFGMTARPTRTVR